jgi:hypothetical protein
MERSPDQPEAQRLTRADVLSTTEVSELLGIPRSTVHHLAPPGRTSPHAVSAGAGSSSATISPRPSHRSTTRPPGARSAASDARALSTSATHVGRERPANTRKNDEKARLCRAFLQRERRDSNPRPPA